jgi:peptide/nickel transport system substrate-binding protein
MSKFGISLALSLLVALSACRDASDDAQRARGEQADTGGTVIVAITNEPDVVNGLLSAERYGQEISRNLLFLPLIQYDTALELSPRLAESWEMHGDTAVTFKLRRDVRWHDGTITNAEDVAFTFQRGRDPKTANPNADYWVGWKAAQVLDSFTVRFTFERQPEPLANLPWIPIMPAHLLRHIPAAELKNAPFNQKPIGNGPFRFVEHRANDRWVFEANREFPSELGGRPYVDRVVLRVIPEVTAQETELRTGNVHLITSITAGMYGPLDQLPNIRGVVKPGKQYLFVAWNNKRQPYDDARLRRALAFAIDREKIVQVVRKNFAQVGVGPVPPFHWSNDTTIKPLPFSRDSARVYLAALGMHDRNNDGFVERPNGRPFTVELKYPASSQTQRDIAELIRGDLQAIGVRLILRGLEFTTLISDVTDPARNFDAAILGFETDFKVVLHDMLHSRALDNPYQFASYRNPSVDSLLDRLATTTSREEATPLWRRLQTIIRDEQPLTFLFYFPDLLAASENLRGRIGDIRGFFAGIQEWWLARPDTVTTTR